MPVMPRICVQYSLIGILLVPKPAQLTGQMNHDKFVQRHASIFPYTIHLPKSNRQPLIAQAHQVIRKFLHSRCSVTCHDVFTVMGDEDSLRSFADDNALLALKGFVY